MKWKNKELQVKVIKEGEAERLDYASGSLLVQIKFGHGSVYSGG